jgi:hypothetical protein
MKRIQMFTILGLVFTVISLIAWPVIRVHHLEDSFSNVQENDTKDLVLKRMGNPWKDEECGKYIGGQPTGCTEELTYAHPYAPYVPEYWIIDLNSDHRVINHVRLISP